jgi:DNA-directed RNA polymerase I, II, and III subunit RPABC2
MSNTKKTMNDTTYFNGEGDDDYLSDNDSDTASVSSTHSEVSSSSSSSSSSNSDTNNIQTGGVEDLNNDDDYVALDNINEEDDNGEDIEEDDLSDDDEDVDYEENPENNKKKQKQKQKNTKQVSLPINNLYNNEDDEDDEDDPTGDAYLKKFDKDVNSNYIMKYHPECIQKNYDEIEGLTKVVRDKDGIIIDDLHHTNPYLTKYERTRILGQRAKQIDAGATPFVKVPENVIDGYLIAILELEQKRIPFIICRPLPNGGSEYWNVEDLENIAF